MFCPQCGAEYRPGLVNSADCALPLVPARIESKPILHAPKLELVTAFESGNPALIALAKSLLDSAEIEFMTKGEGIQDLLGWGRFPRSRNLVSGPVTFQVRPEDAEEARSLLSEIQEREELRPRLDEERDESSDQ